MTGESQLSKSGAPRADAHASIAIRVNGEPRRLPQGSTVVDALALLSAPREGFAVERNGAIVPRSLHGSTRLEEGDRLEIVTFVGGG